MVFSLMIGSNDVFNGKWLWLLFINILLGMLD